MDASRVLAIGAVVLIHVLAPTVEGRGLEVGAPGWWLANVLNSASRWCVPVFLMISGALALDPAKVTRPRAFYRKRWHRIGIPLVFWTAVYLLFRRLVLNPGLTPGQAASDIARGAPFLQLYFLYVLAGLVLITPFLKVFTRHATWRMQLGFGAVLLGLGVVDQVASYLGGIGEPNLATRFLPFAGYYILGWVLRDVLLSRRGIVWCTTLFALSVAVTAMLAAVAGFGAVGRYAYGFLSPTVVVMSITAFLLLHLVFRAQDGWADRWLRPVAPLAFGVFLVHGALVYGFRTVIGVPNDLLEVAVSAVVLTFGYAVVSAAITWVLLQIPYVRMVLGEPALPSRKPSTRPATISAERATSGSPPPGWVEPPVR
jgi:surface polysaccharide O-acyltransferase-like enzyme